MSLRYIASGSADFSPILNAAVGAVGPMITSHCPNAVSKSCLMSRRTLSARPGLGTDHENRVVTGDRADDLFQTRTVERARNHVGRTGRRTEDHQVHRRRDVDDPVAEDPAEVVLGSDLIARQFRYGVHELATGNPHLHRPHILEVTGHGGLGGNNPVVGEQLHQPELTSDRVLFEDPGNPMLSLRFGEPARFAIGLPISAEPLTGRPCTGRTFRRPLLGDEGAALLRLLGRDGRHRIDPCS